jgi:hypothetical protein
MSHEEPSSPVRTRLAVPHEWTTTTYDEVGHGLGTGGKPACRQVCLAPAAFKDAITGALFVEVSVLILWLKVTP